jgi:hypothetical protein
MARALTFRQLARNFQKQADIFTRLAKLQNQAALDLPQNNLATEEQLKVALAAYDLALRSFYSSEGAQAQADTMTAEADAAGEPA